MEQSQVRRDVVFPSAVYPLIALAALAALLYFLSTRTAGVDPLAYVVAFVAGAAAIGLRSLRICSILVAGFAALLCCRLENHPLGAVPISPPLSLDLVPLAALILVYLSSVFRWAVGREDDPRSFRPARKRFWFSRPSAASLGSKTAPSPDDAHGLGPRPIDLAEALLPAVLWPTAAYLLVGTLGYTTVPSAYFHVTEAGVQAAVFVWLVIVASMLGAAGIGWIHARSRGPEENRLFLQGVVLREWGAELRRLAQRAARRRRAG